MREPWAKAHRKARGRDKARGQARLSGSSPPQWGCRRPQMMREKMWIPWNGLVVIGKKMELLGRITQKPRSWDEKLGSECCRPEAAQKAALIVKSGPTQERMDVKLPHNLASALQASAGMEEGSPREIWGKEEVKRETGAESESSETAPVSGRGSGFEESLRSTEEKPGARGEKRRSNGEKLSSEEKLGPSEEDLRFRGYNGLEPRSSAENLRSSGERRGSKAERRGSKAERRGSIGEKQKSSREKRRSSGEKLKLSGEKLEGSGMGSVNEEEIKEVVEVIHDEKVVEVTDEVMDIPFERVERSDEALEGIAEGEEVEGGGLPEVKAIPDESVSMEEKELIGEGTSE